MFGQYSHEIEVNVGASEAWSLYSSLRFAKLVQEELPGLYDKIELLQGDGGVGTIFKLTMPQGTGVSSYIEKFVTMDHEKRIKEAEVIEGGFLDIGFTLFRYRFEVLDKGEDSCTIKSTVEFDVKEESATNASFVSIDPLVTSAEMVKKYLLRNKGKVVQ